MKAIRMTVGLLLLAAGTGTAQSLPPVTKAKQVATKAADAANARTAAMTATPANAQAAARQKRDSAAARSTRSASGSTAEAPAPSALTFQRERFSYDRGGRRDPFVSLMKSGELSPLITDLRVQVIVYDRAGRSHVAVLYDASSKEEYRVRVGTSIGRIRVARIDPKSVTFTIEEFGFSRQETLVLGDPNKEKTQ